MSIGGSTAGRSINLELGRPATQSSNLNETDLRTLAGVPGSGNPISISDFYGASSFTSTGGDATVTLGGKKIHIFLNPGTLSVSGPANAYLVLVAGGGGGGGDRGAGGGGAGGMVYYGPGTSQGASLPISSPAPITVGGGGPGAPGTNNDGTDGSNSTALGKTALGGGAARARSGGSGAGSRHNDSFGFGSGTQPGSASGGYGNPGGPQGPGTNMGSGGGGAGGTGRSGGSSFPPYGQGGDGKPISWLPGPGIYPLLPGPVQSTVGTAWRDALGTDGNLAGGGGGGSNEPPPGGAPGGPGGGGRGGHSYAGSPAVDYTGGGGGGAGYAGTGGDGGNGICVIAFDV